MKQKYFGFNNIEKKSNEIAKEVSSKKIMELRKNINIKDSALLIIDMQKYFTRPSSHAFVPSVKPVMDRVKKLRDIFIASQRPVIFTRHIDNINDKNNMLLKWWRDSIRKEDGLSEIDEKIYIESSITVEKTQYDAFYKTDLDNILKKNQTKKIFITGVVSNLCCETTARSGFVRGYEIYFGIDTTAAYYIKHHISSVLNISYGFGTPFLLKDIK